MASRILKFLLISLLSACQSTLPVQDVTWNDSPDVIAWSGHLATLLHVSLPVMVGEAPLLDQGLLGYTYFAEDSYKILLEETLDPDAKLMVLVHELAHVMVREHGIQESNHGDAWGKAYAEVFRALVGESEDSEDFPLLRPKS